MFFLDKQFVSKMQDIFINEMMVFPARVRDGSYHIEDLTPGYRFEYNIAPEDLPDVGVSPKELVWQEGHVKLFRYKSMSKTQSKTPVLMVYALINRPYILDLRPGNSVVEHLLKNGQDVYLIDWGEPDDEDKYLDLDFYIDHYIDYCVEKTREISGAKKINLFGWCIGGSLALIYAAIHNEKINSLVTLTTPGESKNGGMLSVWSNKEYMDVDKIIQAFGNIPGKFIRYGVIEIYADREMSKNRLFYENMNNPLFMQMYGLIEKWMNDNIDFPGKVFKQYIEHVFQNNSLFEKKLKINGKVVNLENITCPYMNMAAEVDHLVLLESTKIINDYVGSKENVFEVIPGGHLGIAFEPMSQKIGWGKLLEWFKKHSPGTAQQKSNTKAASKRKNLE